MSNRANVSLEADDVDRAVVVRQDGQRLVRLGQRNTFAVVNVYLGDIKIHIRRYTTPETNEQNDFIPTQRGIALSPQELDDLEACLPWLRDRVTEQRMVRLGGGGGGTTATASGVWSGGDYARTHYTQNRPPHSGSLSRPTPTTTNTTSTTNPNNPNNNNSRSSSSSSSSRRGALSLGGPRRKLIIDYSPTPNQPVAAATAEGPEEGEEEDDASSTLADVDPQEWDRDMTDEEAEKTDIDERWDTYRPKRLKSNN